MPAKKKNDSAGSLFVVLQLLVEKRFANSLLAFCLAAWSSRFFTWVSTCWILPGSMVEEIAATVAT